jgi:hypothetical protein
MPILFTCKCLYFWRRALCRTLCTTSIVFACPFHTNPSPCITSQTLFCYMQVEPIFKIIPVSLCYCMHAITDGQGMYTICNMCMWNKDGNKAEREEDKINVRANKYAVCEWLLGLRRIHQTILLTAFNFCLLCWFASYLRMDKKTYFSLNTETCCMCNATRSLHIRY